MAHQPPAVSASSGLMLELLPGLLAVCRLSAESPAPAWAAGAVSSVTRTPTELSVVCAEEAAPPSVHAERGFCCLAVLGPLDFALTGVVASLAAPLAEAGVSIFVLSTFDTDLLLIRHTHLAQAVAVLREAGHRITGVP
jgi:hypothetical protein